MYEMYTAFNWEWLKGHILTTDIPVELQEKWMDDDYDPQT
jgi:hypothetical protein